MRNGSRKGRIISCHKGSEFHGESLGLHSAGSKEATEVLKQRNAMIIPLLLKPPADIHEGRVEVGRSLNNDGRLGGHYSIL